MLIGFDCKCYSAAICVLCGFPLFAQRNAFLLACSSLCKMENGKEESLFIVGIESYRVFLSLPAVFSQSRELKKDRESAKERSQKCSRGLCWQSLKLQVKWKFQSENSIKASEINELARNKVWLTLAQAGFLITVVLRKIAAAEITIVTKFEISSFKFFDEVVELLRFEIIIAIRSIQKTVVKKFPEVSYPNI